MPESADTNEEWRIQLGGCTREGDHVPEGSISDENGRIAVAHFGPNDAWRPLLCHCH